MRKIWEALDAEGRQWRAVYKALSLLEHLIKNGTERVIENARDHMFKLRHLSGFSYHDGSVDRGNGGDACSAGGARSACVADSVVVERRRARSLQCVTRPSSWWTC
jgi:hypothetical protein